MTAVRERSLVREPALWQAVGNTPLLPVEPAGRRGPVLAQGRVAESGRQREGSRRPRHPARRAPPRRLLPGQRLLDASSGNTGIAYAMLGAAAGVGVTICLPANASPERRALLEVYGAEVVVTDRLEGTEGAVASRARAGGRRARPLLLRRSVQQSGQPAGPPGDHGPRALVPDRRADHPFRRRHGHDGHHDGHRRLPEGAEPAHRPGRRAARLTVSRPRRAQAPRDHHASRRRCTIPPCPTAWPRSRPRPPTATPAGSPGARATWWAGRRAPRSPPPSRSFAGSRTPAWWRSAAIPARAI